MNCRQFEHFLDQYLDGDLGGSLKLEFEAHLVDCKPCGHLYAMMDAVGAIIATPAPDEPKLSKGFADRVLAQHREREARPVKFRKTLYRITAAAGVVLVVTGTLFYSLNRSALPADRVGRGSLMAYRTDERNRQEINQWLAGTLEQAGSSLWELKELQSTAVYQVKQGLFKTLTGPARLSETVEISKEQNKPVKSASPDNRMAGLELL